MKKTHKYKKTGLPVVICAIVLFTASCASNSQSSHKYTFSQSQEMRLSESRLRKNEEAANKGDIKAMWLVYGHYSFGDFNEAKCNYWLEELALAGEPPAQFNYGSDLVEKGNSSAGIQWIRKSASNGYDPAVQYLKERGSKQR